MTLIPYVFLCALAGYGLAAAAWFVIHHFSP